MIVALVFWLVAGFALVALGGGVLWHRAYPRLPAGERPSTARADRAGHLGGTVAFALVGVGLLVTAVGFRSTVAGLAARAGAPGASDGPLAALAAYPLIDAGAALAFGGIALGIALSVLAVVDEGRERLR